MGCGERVEDWFRSGGIGGGGEEEEEEGNSGDSTLVGGGGSEAVESWLTFWVRSIVSAPSWRGATSAGPSSCSVCEAGRMLSDEVTTRWLCARVNVCVGMSVAWMVVVYYVVNLYLSGGAVALG